MPLFTLPEGWRFWAGFELVGPNWILFCAHAVIFYFVLSGKTWACLLEIVLAGFLRFQAITYGITYAGYEVKTLGVSVAIASVLLIYFLIRELEGILENRAAASSTSSSTRELKAVPEK